MDIGEDFLVVSKGWPVPVKGELYIVKMQLP
jgi:hypothetical protein